VDLERHRPVEVLLGSDEQVLADWLLVHHIVTPFVGDKSLTLVVEAI